MKLVIAIISLLLCLGVSANMTYRYIVLDQQCTGYLKRAADSNKISRAITELEIALKYLEDNKMTEGYTSVIYRTPDEDVGFWYNNLKESLDNIKKIDTTNISQLEESNVLMKLSETILDTNDSGTAITCPNGLSRFPHNALYALLFWLLLSFAALFFLTVIYEENW